MDINNSKHFIINGFEPKQGSSCPARDPDDVIQITDELVSIYQSRIDSILNQLGKNILLVFNPKVENCPNCELDKLRKRSSGVHTVGGPIPFSFGQVCPFCKGRGLLETPVEKCIKVLIKWNPKDAANYGISVSKTKDIVRFKTFATDYNDLIKCKFAISNYDISDTIKYKVKLIQQPTLIGLRESRYCISFWELI
jgi:hypothetical protein